MKETKFKVVEMFYSVQGEGVHVGTPSIFLRLFGCNLQCQGFGMPEGKLSTERDIIASDVGNYEYLSDVPLSSTGCDSFVSWDKRFSHLSEDLTIYEIVQRIKNLLPNSKFTDDIDLVITGGEPLLKRWQKQLPDLIIALEDNLGLSNVTFETNGTQPLTSELVSFIRFGSGSDFTFSCSVKLSSSGEHPTKAHIPYAIESYVQTGELVIYKFVVSREEDFEEIDNFLNYANNNKLRVPVYLMPVGGCTQEYGPSAKWLADECLKRGIKFTPRLHLDLFGNAWAT